MDKGFIVLIFQDQVPEYTIDAVYETHAEADKAGLQAVEEIQEEIEEKKKNNEPYDTGNFYHKVVDLSKLN